MVQFDESKVINALHADKAEVGKKYYFADALLKLKQVVEDYDVSRLGTCSTIKEHSDMPFIKDGRNGWEYLYPYEEPPKQRMTRLQLMEWTSKGNGGLMMADETLTESQRKICQSLESLERLERLERLRIKHRCTLSATENIKVTEKVFIPKHQEKEYHLPGSLFNFDELM